MIETKRFYIYIYIQLIIYNMRKSHYVVMLSGRPNVATRISINVKWNTLCNGIDGRETRVLSKYLYKTGKPSMPL